MNEVLSENKLFYSVEELRNLGLSYFKINKLVESELLVKLNKKYYENKKYKGEVSDLYYVRPYINNGIISLMTAASYYGLTTIRLHKIDVSIKRKAKVSTMPVWPFFDIHYFSDERYELGVKEIIVDENMFKIYDIEKTVVDIISFKEKIGIDETKEVLINYLSRTDRNINKIIQYAEVLKCDKVLKSYLEVLL